MRFTRSSRKKTNIWSELDSLPLPIKVISVFIIVLLIISGVLSGVKLETEAQQGEVSTTPPAVSGITNIISDVSMEYSGVSIHVKATGPDGVSATVKTGDIVTFLLTINNPEDPKNVDFKFTLPPGFAYNSDASMTPRSQSPDGTNTLYWDGASMNSGDNLVTLTATAP